ncbi:MAG: SpoIIE family protein phosphatase, partial [Treponemataceae bacterium]
MTEETFVEVGFHQAKKHGQGAEGDVFLSRKTEDGRIISVLSDGLGSGIKAGVLATLTATMAIKFIAEEIPLRRAAGIIMKTLPVCKVRHISYATFTIVDIDNSNLVKIVEYDNPPYVLIRERVLVEPLKTDIEVKRAVRTRREATNEKAPIGSKTAIMHYSEFAALPGDRLIFFSDGITQSGMGTHAMPLGWGSSDVEDFALRLATEDPNISARELARRLVLEAETNDAYSAKDDITCGVVYFRRPRRLLVMTGPSVDRTRDREMAEIFDRFPGKRALCGGTTATLIAREL